MKDIINIDDLNLDGSETLESKGFGNMALDKLLKDNDKKVGSKGFNSLLQGKPIQNPKLTKKVETITTEIQDFDPMIMNEILRSVREKNEYVEKKLSVVEEIPAIISEIRSEIQNIKSEDAIQKQISFEKEIKKKKGYIYVFAAFLFVTGMVLGGLMTGTKEDPAIMIKPIVTKTEQRTTVKKALQKLVTNKFANLRDKGSPRSKVIMTISPAQIIDVVSKKGGWLKVNYHNKLTGKKVTGHLWHELLDKVK